MDTLLTEIANESGFNSTCGPLAIRNTAFVVDLEAHLLISLRETVQTTLMSVDKLQGFLISRVTFAKGPRVRLQPVISTTRDSPRLPGVNLHDTGT